MKTKGWIPWTLHLSYDRMLRGIPGTGTRNGGMSGQLLAVNLDAIILFKFHGEKSFICHIFSFTLVDIKAQKFLHIKQFVLLQRSALSPRYGICMYHLHRDYSSPELKWL